MKLVDILGRLFLIGSMGAGKTTMGRQLARQLGYQFYDSDHVLEKRTGVDIPTIFDYEGEEGFRKRESQVIDELTQLDNIVLATGGGAILREENREALKERGFVIYLRVSIREQLKRTSNDKNRPILQIPDRKAKLIELANSRNPIYDALADYSVDTNRFFANKIRQKIINSFKQSNYA